MHMLYVPASFDERFLYDIYSVKMQKLLACPANHKQNIIMIEDSLWSEAEAIYKNVYTTH